MFHVKPPLYPAYNEDLKDVFKTFCPITGPFISRGLQISSTKQNKKKKLVNGKKSEEKYINIEDYGATDLSTLVSGREERKLKKKTRNKLSKSGKDLKKLHKEIAELKANDVYYSGFITHMHQWLQEKAGIAMEMFKHIDVDRDGFVSSSAFKAELLDLNVPLNKAELHLLCQLLDEEDSGEINYTQLKKGLQFAREKRELDQQRGEDDHQLPICTSCKMSIVQPWTEPMPRSILLEVRSVTFDMLPDYPGHLKLLVHTHMTVCCLFHMIVAQTGISSTKLAVFCNKTRQSESVLSPNLTLEECRFQVENPNRPEEVTLYYDYTVEFTDCPLLMCDHYFGQKLQI